MADTPGLHGLFIQSGEEIAVRAHLFAETPDLLVQCVDANRFKESLLLTADLMELGVPLVLVLTAVGERAHRGTRIDVEKLSGLLGAPVVQSPTPGAGLSELTRVLLFPVLPPRPSYYGNGLEQLQRVDGGRGTPCGPGSKA